MVKRYKWQAAAAGSAGNGSRWPPVLHCVNGRQAAVVPKRWQIRHSRNGRRQNNGIGRQAEVTVQNERRR